jgi:four helix bundle protein
MSMPLSVSGLVGLSSGWVVMPLVRTRPASALKRRAKTDDVVENARCHGACALGGMTTQPEDKPPFCSFPHHRLDAHAVALDALVKADAIANLVPRGYAPLADQLRRATQSAYLQTAEGAARFGADRATRLRGARAEACEAAAALEALARLGLVPQPRADEVIALLGRLAAMLTRLIQRR